MIHRDKENLALNKAQNDSQLHYLKHKEYQKEILRKMNRANSLEKVTPTNKYKAFKPEVKLDIK